MSTAPHTAEPTIEKAVELADAAPDPDTVAIQPGSYEVAASGCGGLHVSQVSTYLKGAGIGATILTSPLLSEALLSLAGAALAGISLLFAGPSKAGLVGLPANLAALAIGILLPMS